MKIITALATLALVAGIGVAQAADIPANKKKQTDAGLYVTAIEAAAMKEDGGESVFFVDVRDPIEVMFTGAATSVDANIPFKTANPARWNPKKSTYAMESNPAFLDAMRSALAEQGLTPADPILLMCRSGGRSAAAVNALTKAGFTQVYSVVDGFEGDVNKAIENGPVRSLNGWKNSGLPWTMKLDPEAAYRP